MWADKPLGCRALDTAESIEEIAAELAPETSLEAQEADYERFVEKNLPRNFAGHFLHGMLGMTGFRIFNSPTFLPAYLHLITRAMPGSDFLVSLGVALQQLCSVVSPVVGAAQVEHRKRVLPVSMLMGTMMRVQIAAIALCAWFLHGTLLVVSIMFFLLLLGLFQGAQGVAFQMLLAKVIPTRVRGRLQALRNLAGGQVSAGLAYLAGRYLIGGHMFGNGYATTFALSAILTACVVARTAGWFIDKLGRGDNEPEAISSATEPHVEGHEPAAEHVGNREVFGVVGLGPAELTGDLPCPERQTIRTPLGDPELATEKAFQCLLAKLLGNVAAEDQLVKDRRRLAPEQRRSDQLPIPQLGAASSPILSSDNSTARLASHASTRRTTTATQRQLHRACNHIERDIP